MKEDPKPSGRDGGGGGGGGGGGLAPLDEAEDSDYSDDFDEAEESKGNGHAATASTSPGKFTPSAPSGVSPARNPRGGRTYVLSDSMGMVTGSVREVDENTVFDDFEIEEDEHITKRPLVRPPLPRLLPLPLRLLPMLCSS